MRLQTETPLRVPATVVDGQLGILALSRPVAGLEVEDLEVEILDARRGHGLREDELELLPRSRPENRPRLRAHGQPIDARRRLDGPIGLHCDLESDLLHRSDRRGIELEQWLAAGEYDIGKPPSRLGPDSPDSRRQCFGVCEATSARPIGADEVRVTEITIGPDTVLFTARPEVTPREATEDRSASGARSLALQSEVDLLYAVHVSPVQGTARPLLSHPALFPDMQRRTMLATRSEPSERIPAIDMVKGWAILGVTLIHSTVLDGSLWMSLLFGHAVPVFLVLFGLNSEAWFRRHPPRGRAKAWYLRGVKRILLPAYAMALVWWLMVLVLQPPDPIVRLTPGLPLRHAMGWFHQIGTSWFVTLILQFVVLFPVFHWIYRRFGGRFLFAFGFLITLPTVMFWHGIQLTLGTWGWFFFSPRFFLHVTFGMLLASRVRRLSTRTIFLAIFALLLLDLVYLRVWLPGFWRFADRYLELPLTVLLLWAMGELDWIEPLERGLSWLGQHSYGLYLGQILTHNAFIYVFGGSCTLYGCEDGLFEEFNLWIYTALLLLGSVAFLQLGNAALALNESLRERGYRLPDLRT